MPFSIGPGPAASAASVRKVPCLAHPKWAVPREAGELLLQGFEAGPLLRVPMPAGEHQLVYGVCGGWALCRAGHAVAGIHPQEGLVVVKPTVPRPPERLEHALHLEP